MNNTIESSPIEHINKLLVTDDMYIDVTAEALAGVMDKIEDKFLMRAGMDFEHKHNGRGIEYLWLPKEEPDECIFSSDANPALKDDVKGINPFSKERSSLRVTDVSLPSRYDDEQFVRYDVMPEESDMVFSLFYKRSRIINAGKSLLNLSLKNK